MKKFQIITVGCVMLALTGCFGEDYSLCPPETNVTLNFKLPHPETGVCSFLEDISATTTTIYTEDGVHVTDITVDDHSTAFQGIKTRLEPGVYRVVSWANSGTNSAFNDVPRHYEDNDIYANISYGDINDGMVHHYGDQLYYAPNTTDTGRTRMGTGEGNTDGEYIMTVTERGHEGTLDFRQAHRHVEIFVKGFEAQDASGVITTPVVHLGNLPHGLSFVGMRRISEEGDHVNMRRPSEMVTVGKNGEEGNFALADFSTFYFEMADEDEINVDIIDPTDNTVVFSTTMNEHILPGDINTWESLKLLIEFKQIGVEVTIPGWSSEEVGWGIYE